MDEVTRKLAHDARQGLFEGACYKGLSAEAKAALAALSEEEWEAEVAAEKETKKTEAKAEKKARADAEKKAKAEKEISKD